jgi:glycosyltransferase involved in cell wall biosynthesis
MKVPVSILIPVRNEAANLPRALASVAWAGQIVVVDSASTDGTQEIARRAGATVVQFAFNGVWPKKKNWALAHLPFDYPWVFILDADEVLPPGTGEELAALIAADGAGCDGFWINRRFMFMGTWLRHAYYPNWNLRFFRHALGRYEQLVTGATASGDNEVHEHIMVRGRTGRLRAEMDHYAFPSIGVFIEKHNRYSSWEAQLELEEGHRGARADGAAAPQARGVRWRRHMKRLSHHLPFRPMLRFLYVYVLQGGFLDGRPGYYFARLHAIYEFLSVAKAAELRSRARPEARTEPGIPAGESVQQALPQG